MSAAEPRVTVAVYHHPSTMRDAHARRRFTTRNNLWFAWSRRPLASALRRTVGLLRRIPSGDAAARVGLIEGLRGLTRVLRRRRVVPLHVESKLRMLDRRSTRQEETNR